MMVDISKFLESERKAKERDPEKYARERAEDARRAYKDYERFEDSKLMERYERMQKHKESKEKEAKGTASKGSSARGSAGGGGMNPTDIEKVPGKRQLKFKSGGKVSSASKRADGCAVRGKTKGRMV
jgi:hypothetical protein